MVADLVHFYYHICHIRIFICLMLLVVYFVLKAVFIYKSDCAAFGTAVEQIRRVFDDKNKDNFHQFSIKTYVVGIH